MRTAVLLIVAASLVPAVAECQFIDGPPGAVGGLFGGRRPVAPDESSQRLTMTFNLGGSNDENVAVDPGEGSPLELRSGLTTTAAAGLRYWRGRSSRYFQATSEAWVRGDRPTQPIASANIDGASQFGRRGGGALGIGSSFEPTALSTGVNLPSNVDSEVETVADLTLPQGILEQRSMLFSAYGSTYRNWTPRQRTEVRYDASQRRITQGPGQDTGAHSAGVGHSWRIRQNFSWTASYRYERFDQTMDAGVESQPAQFHSSEIGLQVARRLSPTRNLSATLNGGLTRATRRPTSAAQTSTHVLPVVAGNVQLALSPSLNITAEARRDSSVLEGVSLEAFATNIYSLGLNTSLFGRVTLASVASFARGSSLDSDTGAYEAAAVSTQLQYPIARYAAVSADYALYDHRYIDLTAAPADFPSRYRRHSIRLSIVVWLPLYGTF